jgi:hypothetical protein
LQFKKCLFLHTYFLQLNQYIGQPYTNLFKSFDKVNKKILHGIKSDPTFFNTFYLLQKLPSSLTEAEHGSLRLHSNYIILRKELENEKILIIPLPTAEEIAAERAAMGVDELVPVPPVPPVPPQEGPPPPPEGPPGKMEVDVLQSGTVPPAEEEEEGYDSPYETTQHEQYSPAASEGVASLDDDDDYSHPIESTNPDDRIEESGVAGVPSLSYQRNGNKNGGARTKSSSIKRFTSGRTKRRKSIKRKIIIEVKG